MKITIKDLRQLLTEVDDQELTVRQLRRILFDEPNEDFELNNITCRKLAQLTKYNRYKIERFTNSVLCISDLKTGTIIRPECLNLKQIKKIYEKFPELKDKYRIYTNENIFKLIKE